MATTYTTTMAKWFMDFLAQPEGDDWFSELFPPGHYLGYMGVLAAFTFSCMGAYSSASISLKYIQDGFTDFLGEYAGVSNADSTVRLFFWYFSSPKRP